MTNKISYPDKSEMLAEECGIHLGDGYMDIKKNKWGIHYEYSYSAHAIEDKPYSQYVESLMKSLYNLSNGYKTLHGNEFRLCYNSKELINFKLAIGMPLSPKENMKIPTWIKAKRNLLATFLMGIFDTDGSLMFKSKNDRLHDYPNIYLSLKDKSLINEIKEALLTFNLITSYCKVISFDKRTNKTYLKYGLCLSGIEKLTSFINEIGFNNEKHLTKYKIWKRFGFCPPKTTLNQRKNLLKGTLNINLFKK